MSSEPIVSCYRSLPIRCCQVVDKDIKSFDESTIQNAVTCALNDARNENRLICGLVPTIKFMNKCPNESLLCLIPQEESDDPSIHIYTVLFQAYCYENYVPVIQVDSAEKLAEFCGSMSPNAIKTPKCFCAVITTDPYIEISLDKEPPLSPSEKILTEFYEYTRRKNLRHIVEFTLYDES